MLITAPNRQDGREGVTASPTVAPAVVPSATRTARRSPNRAATFPLGSYERAYATRIPVSDAPTTPREMLNVPIIAGTTGPTTTCANALRSTTLGRARGACAFRASATDSLSSHAGVGVHGIRRLISHCFPACSALSIGILGGERPSLLVSYFGKVRKSWPHIPIDSCSGPNNYRCQYVPHVHRVVVHIRKSADNDVDDRNMCPRSWVEQVDY